MPRSEHPNIVFVFADQMRAQACGYAGDPNVRTPNLDRLAAEGVNFTNAVAGCPVCTPYRASLITGQYPLTNGVFQNDVCLADLAPDAVSLAEAVRAAGYRTAYIGKWHIDGHGRTGYIPPERRLGFQFWRTLECTHKYNESPYYADDDPTKRIWEGYDAIAQTREAQRYLRAAAGKSGKSGDTDLEFVSPDFPDSAPFLLVLSWGPPHNPYGTAPDQFRALYGPEAVALRPNVPDDCADRAREDLAGYYAHISALDHCIGELRRTLRETGLEENTIFVFTSDHGDMLGSHGQQRKQRPWDESIRVPFLVRWPAGLGPEPRTVEKIIDAPDVMPTLLSLAGVAVPETVEGADLTPFIHGQPAPDDDAALLMCASPFGEFIRRNGGREYRGIRTHRHTYVRDLTGPWLLYDNDADPYQMTNLAESGRNQGRNQGTQISSLCPPISPDLQSRLDALLDRRLADTNDAFLPADHYIEKWGYTVDKDGTVPFGP